MDLTGITFLEFVFALVMAIVIFLIAGIISLWFVDKCEDLYYIIRKKITGYKYSK